MLLGWLAPVLGQSVYLLDSKTGAEVQGEVHRGDLFDLATSYFYPS